MGVSYMDYDGYITAAFYAAMRPEELFPYCTASRLSDKTNKINEHMKNKYKRAPFNRLEGLESFLDTFAYSYRIVYGVFYYKNLHPLVAIVRIALMDIEKLKQDKIIAALSGSKAPRIRATIICRALLNRYWPTWREEIKYHSWPEKYENIYT